MTKTIMKQGYCEASADFVLDYRGDLRDAILERN